MSATRQAVIEATDFTTEQYKRKYEANGYTVVEAVITNKELHSQKKFPHSEFRRVLNVYAKRFQVAADRDELGDLLEAEYDGIALFDNNFVSIFATDNIRAAWHAASLLGGSTELVVRQLVARRKVPKRPTAPVASAAASATAKAAALPKPPPDIVELDIVVQQRWRLPRLLYLVKLLYKEVVTFDVTATLTFDAKGKILTHRERFHNWLSLPAVFRLGASAWGPVLTSVLDW